MRADKIKTTTFWFRFSKILLVFFAVLSLIFAGQAQLTTFASSEQPEDVSPPTQGDPSSDTAPDPAPAEDPNNAPVFTPPEAPAEMPVERPLEGGAGTGTQDCTTNPNQPQCKDGNPAPTQVPNQPSGGSTPTQTSTCSTHEETYPQCGGTVGLENFPATDTIIVGKTVDCNGAIKGYRVIENKGNLGQCQQAQQPVPQTQQRTSVCTPNEFDSNMCRRCSGDGTFWGNPGSDFGPNGGSSVWCSCAQRFASDFSTSGTFAICRSAAGQPAPAQPAPQPTQAPSPQVNRQEVPQCNGTLEVRNGANVCVTQQNSQQQRVDVRAQGGNATVTNSGNSTAPAPREVVSRVEIVREQPKEEQVTRVTCPENTTKKVTATEITCEVNQPKVVVAAVPQTKVAGVTATELPKTGLPAIAWAAGAFLPMGLKFKRFSKDKNLNSEITANYLWELKKFKKNIS